MNRLRLAALALLCGWVVAPGAHAAEATALDAYLAGLSTWSANFTQSGVDAQQKAVAGARGRLVIVRPGRFRWESVPDGADDAVQVLVADGRNLWFHDRDLEQVTVRPQAEALARSPAMLLASGTDPRAAFHLKAEGRRDGLDWVGAQPKDPASDFREVRFGFRDKELARLVIVDKLGQSSTLAFRDVKRNAPVAPGTMEFVLPPGVDLIGKPVPP